MKTKLSGKVLIGFSMVLMTLNTAPLKAQYSWEYLCDDCNPPEWQLLNFAFYEKAKDMCKFSRNQPDYISLYKERARNEFDYFGLHKHEWTKGIAEGTGVFFAANPDFDPNQKAANEFCEFLIRSIDHCMKGYIHERY